MSTPPADHPITDVCIVNDPEKCPPGYECIKSSKDRSEDCDLWKDSFFKSRVTRYVCFTRTYPNENGRANNVLSDVMLNNEREPPPSGFTLLDVTIDTREKATTKKQICVKLSPRNITPQAISNLIILSRTKRAPPEYTLIGEINGLALCFKMNPVPPDTTRKTEQTPVQAAYQPYSGQGVPPYGAQPAAPSHPYGGQRPRHQRQGSLIQPMSAMAGVPFQMHARFGDAESLRQFTAPDVHYRSLVDLENEYNYPFRIERSASCQIPNSFDDE